MLTLPTRTDSDDLTLVYLFDQPNGWITTNGWAPVDLKIRILDDRDTKRTCVLTSPMFRLLRLLEF